MNYLQRLFLGCIAILLISLPARGEAPKMVAHCIDVGQGLSILLEFPCGAVLIDTGGQDLDHLDYLHGYLADFFQRRADLKNTLNTMFITHPHIDHTRGIRVVTEVCRVKNFVDDGMVKGSGGPQVKWIRDHAAALGVKIRPVSIEEIEALPNKAGLTDAAIDDVKCPTCDPKIVVLSGGRSTNPGWTDADFKNWNNHSLVIRVDFGKASFLFTGDLEKPAIKSLLGYYNGTPMLRAKVNQVGHHGSDNATTPELVEAISPEVALIGMGKWDFGKGDSSGPFTTWRYGHPRKETIDLYSEIIPGLRATPLATKVFTGSQKPVDYVVRKKIYGTGWDGDVKVTADLDGTLSVATRNDGGPAPKLVKSNRNNLRSDEVRSPHDSVTPQSLVTPIVRPQSFVQPPMIEPIPYVPLVTQGWDCPPRRGLFHRRR